MGFEDYLALVINKRHMHKNNNAKIKQLKLARKGMLGFIDNYCFKDMPSYMLYIDNISL